MTERTFSPKLVNKRLLDPAHPLLTGSGGEAAHLSIVERADVGRTKEEPG